MDKEYKLGVDLIEDDAILDPIRFDDVILAMVAGEKSFDQKTAEKVFKNILEDRLEDAFDIFRRNINEIVQACYRDDDDKPLEQHPDYSLETVTQLVSDLVEYLKSVGCLADVCFFYGGRRKFFDSAGEQAVEDDEEDPRSYFEYVANPHILSMSFEGGLHAILNGYTDPRFETQFSNILSKYGLFYELGDAWNLTVFPIS